MAGNPAEFNTGQFGVDFLGLKVLGYTVPDLTGSFNVDYVGDPFLLQGDTAILLPPLGNELGIEFGMRNGDFDYGRFSFEFPPGQLLVATDVFMRKIGFEVQKASSCEKPTKIAGSVGFVTGPNVGKLALIGVPGENKAEAMRELPSGDHAAREDRQPDRRRRPRRPLTWRRRPTTDPAEAAGTYARERQRSASGSQ